MGRALLAAGRTEEGTAILVPLGKRPKQIRAWRSIMRKCFCVRKLSTRLPEVLSKALETHPDDVQMVLALGVSRYGQRRFDDAIVAFLRVIRLDPQVEQPYLFLGKLLDQAGDHITEITADYEKWSARNPKNAAGFLLLAKARLASDPKSETAEVLLRKSIGLDGANWEAHYELGVLLEGKRDWTAAATELRRSAELDEAQAMPHYHLARVYDRLGEGEKAKAERELHARLTSPAN